MTRKESLYMFSTDAAIVGFSIHVWFNLQMRNPQIQSEDCTKTNDVTQQEVPEKNKIGPEDTGMGVEKGRWAPVAWVQGSFHSEDSWLHRFPLINHFICSNHDAILKVGLTVVNIQSGQKSAVYEDRGESIGNSRRAALKVSNETQIVGHSARQLAWDRSFLPDFSHLYHKRNSQLCVSLFLQYLSNSFYPSPALITPCFNSYSFWYIL